jgi:hypothetical protein
MRFIPSLSLLCACLLPCLGLAQPPADARKPAVLFTGAFGGNCGHQVAGKLAAAGFALNAAPYPGLQDTALTIEQARKYNVIVVHGLGLANADATLPAHVQQTVSVLRQYLEEGGGVVMLSAFGQMGTETPPQHAFLKPLGFTPLPLEMPTDSDSVKATAWKLDFAYTTAFAESPVTAGVKGLWYPAVLSRAGAQNHATSFIVDNSWTVLVRGGKSSQTRKFGADGFSPGEPGTYNRDVPLVAARPVGKGRLVYLGISPEYLYSRPAMTTLEGVVLERGLKQLPSGGYTLFENILRWLGEPSAATFGGAVMDQKLLVDPQKTVFGAPYTWPAEVTFPAVEPAWPGVIGARTRYSSGKGTPDEWVAKAKAKGLAYLVFLEEFSKLSQENFEKLKADCTRLSTPEFNAVPGFTIDDEVGNHYFYFGPTFPYPDKKVLNADGTVFVSYDPGAHPKDPYKKGQLAMTTLEYAYSLCSFKLTAGNYLFSQDAAPFADFFSDYNAVGVVTARQGKLVEDATADYLKIVDSGQGPQPLAIDLLDDPAQLDASVWRTVLRMPAQGGRLVSGQVNGATKARDYFSLWHYYPDNPSKIYVTNGPDIESWCYTGARDYGGDNNGWFNWANLRWALRGKVSSPAGLKEVAVYDGPTLYRRFLPGGTPSFEFTLDVTHDQQHNFALVVTDLQGRKAVSGEQWDRHHFAEEFMCSDRNNQLSYGWLTRKDGIGVLIGGNQSLGTPLKRISSEVSPSGTFKNDALLGAPAFDGGAGGEPVVIEITGPRQPGRPAINPTVSESKRLMHNGDVQIGEGVREHSFIDNVPTYNVWHTLWRTQPATDYTVTRRNHFFQIDPDSPLPVFLWQIDLTLKEDLPNQGFDILVMRSGDDRLWTVHGSDGRQISGTWEETSRSADRYLNVPFGKGAYVAYLDSPLGGAAIFSLTDGLLSSMGLPRRSNLYVQLTPAAAPRKKGETKRIELLLVGVPRITDGTKNLPGATSEVVDRFYHDFALDGGPAGYTVQATAGTVTGQRYILAIDGAAAGFSGTVTGKLISSLPITVSGLNNKWSSFLYDRALKKARPVGTFEGRAWATVVLDGGKNLFIGQPITADNPNLAIQLTQSGEAAWKLEIHNPTDAPITATVKKNPLFDPLKDKPFSEEKLTIPAGGSIYRTL